MKKTIKQQLYELSICKEYIQSIKIEIQQINLSQHYQIIYQSKCILIQAPIPITQFNEQCRNRIQLQINKGKKNKDVILIGYSNNGVLENLYYLNSLQQDDLGMLQDSQKSSCVGLIINRQGQSQPLKRIKTQLKSSMQKKLTNIYQKSSQNRSKLDDIQIYLAKQYRRFIIIEIQKNNKLLHTCCHFPKIDFKIKEIKLSRSKYVVNQVIGKITKHQYKINTFGFLSQDDRGRLILLEKEDPSLSESFLTGVWVYGNFMTKKGQFTCLDKSQSYVFWVIVTEYLRMKNIKRISTLVKNTGFICAFDQNSSRPTLYLFDLNDTIKSNKWKILTTTLKFQQFPSSIDFNQRQNQQLPQPIQQKHHMKQKSLEQQQNKQRQYKKYLQQNNSQQNLFDNSKSQLDNRSNKQISDSRSQKSYDQRDVQIKVLKKQLQFYKSKYQQLQKMLFNPMMIMMMNQGYLQNSNNMSNLQNYSNNGSMYNSRFRNSQYQYKNQIIQYQQKQFNKNNSQQKYQQKDKQIINPNKSQKKNIYYFPSYDQEQMTFQCKNSQEKQIDYNDNKIFFKKNYSKQENHKQQFVKRLSQQNNYSQDYKNISFGDHSQQIGQDNNYSQPITTNHNNQSYQQDQLKYNRSPQFKLTPQIKIQQDSSKSSLNYNVSNSRNQDFKNFKDVEKSIEIQIIPSQKQSITKKVSLDSDSDSSDQQIKKLEYRYGKS